MKLIPLFVIGGIVAELIMFAIATVMSLNGWELIITIGILPVGLIVGSIVFLLTKMFQDEPPPAPEKDEKTDKQTD